MEQEPSFTPELFDFLRELRANNERPWFQANKARYEAVAQEPALAFIEDVGYLLPEVSPHFSGSLFRIYRDTRFAKDKTPYKTHVGMYFRHVRGREIQAPIYYLHLEPERVFMGVGCWHPERELLRGIRDTIAGRPDRWLAATGDPAFTARFRLAGESLKRAPAGFPPDHPQIEALRRKSFIATAELSEAAAVGPGFLDEFTGLARAADPFMRFLCECAGVEY